MGQLLLNKMYSRVSKFAWYLPLALYIICAPDLIRLLRGALSMSHCTRFLVGIAIATMLPGLLPAQSIYGTLTGIVSDPSQAVVAGAAITLRDEQSGSQRETVTNTDGYYSFV